MKKLAVPGAKTLVDALLEQGSAVPGFVAEDVARARALASDLEASAPSELESLPEELALAVLESAVRSRDPRLPEALASSSRKALAKAGKKALYRLRSLGVAVPEKKVDPPPAASPAAAAEELPSLLSAVSGSGEQALVVPRPRRGGGLEVAQFVISDEKGIVHLAENEVSRGGYRKQLREIRGGRTAPAIEISSEEARRILSAAAAQNVETKTDYPPGTDQALRHLGAAPHREELQLPAPEAGDERLATEGARLHQQPEMQPWLPPESQIRLLVAKSEEIIHSPLQLTEAQKSEQLVHQFRSAARAFFTPEVEKLYARRLWRMAEFFEHTGRPQPASVARAEAKRLFHRAVEPFSRFAEFLFEKVLLLSQRAQAGKPLPQPGGPGPQPPAEHRSPGGLILP
jgi:hypothetical protein